MTNPVSSQQVDAIVQRVLAELRQQKARTGGSTAAVATPAQVGSGLFADVDGAVTAARTAYEQLDGMTLTKRKEIIAAIRAVMREHATELAQMAHSETGPDRWQD